MTSNFRKPQFIQWPDLPMPTARMACVGYVLLIIYASLYPFNFNLQVGVEQFEWFWAPIPRYITSFDIFTNILGYVPLGFLLVFALYPRSRGYQALWIALLVGGLLSGVLESLQTWLMSRIPSNVDWWANLGGVAIGALLAMPMDPRWLSGTAFQRKRHEWFGQRSSVLILILAFPFAQIYPQTAWLAMGDLPDWLWSPKLWRVDVNFASLEIATTMMAWLAASLIIALAMRDSAPRYRLLSVLLIMTVLMKALFAGMQFGVGRSFVWLTPAALWGMIFSSIVLMAILQLKRRYIYLLAILAFVCVLILVNLFPKNPYFLVALQEWRQGRLIHFNSLLSWLAWLWPLLAALSLLKGLKTKPSI